MADEPMTLIERLRAPAYEGEPGEPVRLNVARTLADMREAADRLEQAEMK